MCETQQIGHFFFYQSENLEKARKWREEIRIFSDTLKKAILQWFWVLGSGFGGQKAQGPDLAPGPVKQTFL